MLISDRFGDEKHMQKTYIITRAGSWDMVRLQPREENSEYLGILSDGSSTLSVLKCIGQDDIPLTGMVGWGCSWVRRRQWGERLKGQVGTGCETSHKLRG
jgi:hypothetical protein